MWSLWRAWSVTLCACVVLAQRIDQGPLVNPRQGRVREREREIKQDEPTCDQLKEMWRFSKRQARAPEIMNEVSSYRDPLMFNEWPVYTALPRQPPRFRYGQVQNKPTYGPWGRVVTKAPPNVVRTPDYDEMFGTLNAPQQSGGVLLRFSGPSRLHSVAPPPQRDRFDTLKNMIRLEHLRELQRKQAAEQRQQELNNLEYARSGEDYSNGNYGEQEPRGLQPSQLEYTAEEPAARQHKKPTAGNHAQLYQYSRGTRGMDMVVPPVRRTFYHPYYDFAAPEFVPYVY